MSLKISYHHGPPEILFWNPSSTEHVSVSKVLCGDIPNRQFGENNLGSGLVDLVQFVVQDVPLGIYNGLIVLE